MAVNPATWLVDKSVLARLDQPSVREVLLPRIRAGRVAVSVVTELEVGYSARSTKDYKTVRETLLDFLLPVFISPRSEQRARDVQSQLISRGQHRAVSVPDLLVAAIAETEHMSVLHYDSDFELIAQVTGQQVDWIVPKGTVD